jgi:hypothetical protein
MAQQRSPEDFLRWLDDVLAVIRLYVDERRPLPKGVTRFGYFHSVVTYEAWLNLEPQAYDRILAFEDPKRSAMRVAVAEDIPPTHKVPPSARELFEVLYRKAHEGGDPTAIFEFARDDREALKASWVVEQLLAWRKEGSEEAKRLFNRFMRAYWSHQGQRDDAHMLEMIERDQAIYWEFCSRGPQTTWQQMIATLAAKHGIGTESVRPVLKHYNKFYRDMFIPGKPFPRPIL